MAATESESATIEQLREDRALLTRRLRRRSEALQFVQLMTKTFISLSLKDEDEICDTLNSLILSFLEARFGAVLLRSGDGSYRIAGHRGADVAALAGAGAPRALASLTDDKIAQYVDASRAASLWPDRPAPMRDGFACCAIETHDAPVGLILASEKSSGEAVSAEELEFISAAAGLGGMALTNAELLVAQKSLTRDVELQVEEARRESQAKQRALEELDRKLLVIERQRSAIRELSTPVLQLWDDVLALPIIGAVDVARSEEITERLLSEVAAQRARFVIMDLTGVELVDTHTADSLLRVMRSTALLGTTCILTGIRPAVAQALVGVGADLSSVITLRNLREGLAECLRQTGRGLEG